MQRVINTLVDRLPIRVVKSISALQWRAPWLRKLFLRVGRSYSNRDGTIQRGPAKGLTFNAGQARNAGFLLGTYEPEVQTVYASLVSPGMAVYDVGANVGFLAMLAANLVGPSGSVICFEPLPANIEAIQHNAALNSFSNIAIIPEALGNQDSVAEFLVSADVGWGRLAGAKDPSEMKESVSVLVRTLNTAVREHKLPPPDLIKIDIEGGETGMLDGSREVLNQCRPILLIELHGTNQDVDRILREVQYNSYVLGESRSIVQAPWDAFVIGVPAENTGKCEIAQNAAKRAMFGR